MKSLVHNRAVRGRRTEIGRFLAISPLEASEVTTGCESRLPDSRFPLSRGVVLGRFRCTAGRLLARTSPVV